MNIRKTNQTPIAAAIALSALFLLTSCKTDAAGQVQTEPGTVEEETLNQADSPKDEESREEYKEDSKTAVEITAETTDIYDYILAEYSDMVQNDFYMDLRDSDSYESCFGEDIGLEIRTHKQSIYYTLYDIDGNGTMELIIAGGENGTSVPLTTVLDWYSIQ